jgi:hypothetical protein
MQNMPNIIEDQEAWFIDQAQITLSPALLTINRYNIGLLE